jgi:hypothetical protein
MNHSVPSSPASRARLRAVVRRAALVAAACLLLPASASANNEPPVGCSATPASAYVGDAIAFHAAAPGGTAGTVHWYVDYSGLGTLADTGLTGATVDLSHAFTTATSTFGDHVSVGYLDADGDPSNIPLCNIDYVAAERPDLAPTAALDGPATVAAGQPATFNAAGSTDPEGQPLHYAFDFDGSPGYEVDNGSSPVASYTFPQGGARTVSVYVTDPAGHGASAYRQLTITSGPAGGGGGQGGGGGGGGTTPPNVNPGRFTVAITIPARRQHLQAVLVSGFEFSVVSSHAAKTLTAQLYVASTKLVRKKGKKGRGGKLVRVVTKLPVGDAGKDFLLGPGSRPFSREPGVSSKAATAIRTAIKRRRSLTLMVTYSVTDGLGKTLKGSKSFIVK